MNGRIQDLLKQMSELEDELRTAIAEQQSSIFFQVKGKRIEFKTLLKKHTKDSKQASSIGWSLIVHLTSLPAPSFMR